MSFWLSQTIAARDKLTKLTSAHFLQPNFVETTYRFFLTNGNPDLGHT